MAKILVADDNSNVQKTVALALADLGVEVIAVNNGEAAVRKLSDVMPDLVLADIFMPVRNGYEVCEYVKKDGRFSHLPVVLLVGAFDPLDEREAQRVGADGILKKPFVPPDPLIAMVKMLLDRTLGDRFVAVGASEPAVAMRGTVGGIAAGNAQSPSTVTATPLPEELPEEEFHPPVNRLSFGDGARPMAFGQLLEAPEQSAAPEMGRVEPVEDEQILTSSRDASLGDPIFWKVEEPEPEHTEEDSETERDISSDTPMRAWKPDEEAIARNADADFLQPVEPFELVREENDDESGQTSTMVEPSSIIAQDAASQASLNVESRPPDDLAANPIEWMASVPPPPADEAPEAATEWGAITPENNQNDYDRDVDNRNVLNPTAIEVPPESWDAASTLPSVANSAPASVRSAAPIAEPPQATNAVQVPASGSAQPLLNHLAESPEDTARAIPKHDWSDIAASLHSEPAGANEKGLEAEPAPIAKAPAAPAASAQPISANSAAPAPTKSIQTVDDIAHSIPKHDWADLAASFQSKPVEAVEEKHVGPSAPVANVPAVPTAPAQPVPANSVSAASTKSNHITEDTAHSIPKHDWADLAASLQSEPVKAVEEKHEGASAPVTKVSVAPVAAAQPVSANSASPGPTKSNQSTDDTAHLIPKHDWADLTATFPSAHVESVSDKAATNSVAPTQPMPAANPLTAPAAVAQNPRATMATDQTTPTNTAPSPLPDPVLVEAIVQRILDKMRPQVVEIITKEFLRPIVQALVHREITKR